MFIEGLLCFYRGSSGNFSKAESALFVFLYWLLKRSPTLIQEFSELISLCVTWYRKITFCSVVYVKFYWTNKQNRGWQKESHSDLKQQQQKPVLLRLRKTVKHLRENEEKRDSEFTVTNTEQPLQSYSPGKKGLQRKLKTLEHCSPTLISC